MSFDNYEESGYGLNLELLTILLIACFISRGSGLVGKSNHFSQHVTVTFSQHGKGNHE